MSEDSEDNVNRELFRNIEKLRQLRIEHRDLDQVISRLAMDIHTDEVQMRRLKKRSCSRTRSRSWKARRFRT